MRDTCSQGAALTPRISFNRNCGQRMPRRLTSALIVLTRLRLRPTSSRGWVSSLSNVVKTGSGQAERRQRRLPIDDRRAVDGPRRSWTAGACRELTTFGCGSHREARHPGSGVHRSDVPQRVHPSSPAQERGGLFPLPSRGDLRLFRYRDRTDVAHQAHRKTRLAKRKQLAKKVSL
jgi:hypothetical protein